MLDINHGEVNTISLVLARLELHSLSNGLVELFLLHFKTYITTSCMRCLVLVVVEEEVAVSMALTPAATTPAAITPTTELSTALEALQASQ